MNGYPDTLLIDQDMVRLFECMNSDDQDIVLDAYMLTESQIANPLNPLNKKFNDLCAKDRFTLIVVALHTLLLMAIEDTNGGAYAT